MPTFFRPPRRTVGKRQRRWLPPGKSSSAIIVTPAIISFAGQDITHGFAAPLAQATLNFAGQTHNAIFGTVVTNAALNFAGQAIAFTFTQALGVGTLNFLGQSQQLVASIGITNAALTLSGQDHVFTFGIVAENAVIEFSGVDLPSRSQLRQRISIELMGGRLGGGSSGGRALAGGVSSGSTRFRGNG